MRHHRMRFGHAHGAAPGGKWRARACALVILAPAVAVSGLGGLTGASASTNAVGTPAHPQVLTCAEEATQFTGTLPRVGPHDVGFGPGYFPRARVLADMNPPSASRGTPFTGYKLPPVVDPGATVTMTDRPWRAVIRRATESVVAEPGKPVGHVSGLRAQARVLSSELPLHRRSTTGLRSPRRAGGWAAQDEPHRALVLCRTLQHFGLSCRPFGRGGLGAESHAELRLGPPGRVRADVCG